MTWGYRFQRRDYPVALVALLPAALFAATPARADDGNVAADGGGATTSAGDLAAEIDNSPPRPQSPDLAPNTFEPTDLESEEVLFLPGEVVEIWAERPKKAFDRDTALRITGDELAKRGVTDLAQALELVPELHIRQSGRGGVQANIRGARKAGVKILIDGVAVDEVYYGTFDVSSIPVTDIAQIRVSTSPSSPIDGLGGPGGVIEVHTLDASGGRLVRARAEASDMPSANVSATGRADLGAGLSARASLAATLGMRDFQIMQRGTPAQVGEDRESVNGALRVEWQRGEHRLAADAFVQARNYVVPPGSEGMSTILVIDRELSTRTGLIADIDAGATRLQGRAYAQTLARDSRYFRDAGLTDQTQSENLDGSRIGGAIVANHPYSSRLHFVASATVDSESATVQTKSSRSGGRSTMSEVAAGAQLEEGAWKVDAAAGVGLPLGVGRAPWPEAKLAVTWAPADAVAFKVIGARKGRLPTTRERFRSDIGNDELSPEIATFGEVEVTLTPSSRVDVKVGAYARRTDGQIRFLGDENQLVNIDNLDVRGVDTSIVYRPIRGLRLGGHWNFLDSYSPLLGTNSLDFLPQHRGELWAAGHYDRFGGRLRVRYTGEQIDRNNTIASFTTVDMSAYAHLHRTLDATLRIENIADRRYEVRSGGVLSPGRVVYLSLQSHWD